MTGLPAKLEAALAAKGAYEQITNEPSHGQVSQARLVETVLDSGLTEVLAAEAWARTPVEDLRAVRNMV